MTAMHNVVALAIDLDGTLMDTEAEICAAVNHALATVALPPLAQEQIVRLTGAGSHRLMRAALALAHAAAGLPSPRPLCTDGQLDGLVEVFRAHYQAILGTRTTLYPGARAALQMLAQQGIACVCVTNKREDDAALLLQRFAVDGYFQALFAPASEAERKPSPVMLQRAAARLGIATSALALIGDSDNDVASARAAGAVAIRVQGGYDRFNPAPLPADAQFADLAEAVAALLPRLSKLPA